MIKNTFSRSKLVRFTITYFFVMGGLAIALTNAKPTLIFQAANSELWRVAPNHAYIVGMSDRIFYYARPYVITEDSVVLLSNDTNLQYDDIYIAPNSEVIATTQRQQVDFIRPNGQFLKQVDLSNHVGIIAHISWSPDSESLIVLGADSTTCSENSERCEQIKLLQIYLNDDRIERIDAPTCNIPQQPQCLRLHARGQIYWRLDGRAFYLAADTDGHTQAYWYRIPLDAPEDIELIQTAGIYLLETYEYYPQQVFAGEWNIRHTSGYLPFVPSLFKRVRFGYFKYKPEGNDSAVLGGLLVSVLALYFGAIRPRQLVGSSSHNEFDHRG